MAPASRSSCPRVGILGLAGSGKEELTLVLANLLDPDAGRVLINEVEVHKPEAITGRRITHVGYPAQIFSARSPTICCSDCAIVRSGRGTWRALRPRSSSDLLEAQRSGNLPFDSEADWIDYASAGLSGPRRWCRRRYGR